MAKTQGEITELARKVTALPTAEKLSMAAMLIDRDRLDVAEMVATLALEDLQSIRLLKIQRAPLT